MALMFDPIESARVFAIPMGRDFSRNFAEGLLKRTQKMPPEALARVLVLTNSARMGTAIREHLSATGARLLPRIHAVPNVPDLPEFRLSLPPKTPALRRTLMLSQAVGAFLRAEPDVAPQSARFSMAAMLAELMDEMQAEGVAPADLQKIDVARHSEHWARNLRFLNIIAQHWEGRRGVDPNDRLRLATDLLRERWKTVPPDHPIIIAGSTGSRGATARLMQAVASLPQGAVVLPGWDDAQPQHVWSKMAEKQILQDHPQSMLLQRCQQLGVDPAGLPDWVGENARESARNTLISLALRPAPFTDDWLLEGPGLKTQIKSATEGLSLLEAPSPKAEADAIALRLRGALQDGKSALLISPDRNLTRRVTAALRRWGIDPDDSAGRPLQQTPPAIFARLIASAIGTPLRPDVLTAILKHPMAGSADRQSRRKLISRVFEIKHLRGGPPEVVPGDILDWADTQKDPEVSAWAEWVVGALAPIIGLGHGSVSEFVSVHKSAAEALAMSEEASENPLWSENDGEDLARVFADLEAEAEAAGEMSAADYRNLFYTVLSSRQSRVSRFGHPSIAILGTLEARVGQRDLVILAGLNDDIWPGVETPDPWLNREMRRQLGLPTADRQTGLSAHDFQQAICAPEVMLTRALRDGDAPTVASRWIVRINNLLAGIDEVGGDALSAMKERGQQWMTWAGQMDQPNAPTTAAPRPAPCPPTDARLAELSVTAVERLIRDPYAIYAGEILRLKKLKPLQAEPDARARGTALHEVMERFNKTHPKTMPDNAADTFMALARDTMGEVVPWPGLRQLWLTRLSRVAEHLMEQEASRRQSGFVAAQEVWGERQLEDPPTRLFGKADRIDRLHDGRLTIYDYKATKPPSKDEVKYFQKQLDLEAAIAEAGGFSKLGGGAEVAFLEYIGLSGDGLGGQSKTEGRPLTTEETEQIWEEFQELMRSFADPDQCFPSRPRMQKLDYAFDYDHLARKGEWWESDDPVRIDLT